MSERRKDSTLVHNNKHGYRGIWFDSKREKFVATICGKNKRGTHLGRFDTAKDAAITYDAAAIEEYGDDAHLNFPLKGEKPTIKSKLKDGFCPKAHEFKIHGKINNRGNLICKRCNADASNRYYSKNKFNNPKDGQDGEGKHDAD